MKRIAVLSTNGNPDYAFYLPIVTWLWNKFGWEVAVFYTSDAKQMITDWNAKSTVYTYQIPDIDGVRTGSLAQVVRHFVSNVLPKDAYTMVQDIDLLPLKPYEPDLEKMTIWGWDLTGYSFIPVHYTGMRGDKWYEFMGCTGDLKADMEREMKANGRAYQEKWEDYWDADWDILTQKVLKNKDKFTFIDRGMVTLGQHATPKGRVDRYSIVVGKDGSYSWGVTLNQPDLIDAHCENHNPSSPEKWANIRALLVQVFGEIPDWMDNYVIEHHKKYGR